MSTKFPPVKALNEIFGLREGTELKFDYDLAKYVSRVESEDIGDDNYYYSGSAVAIDPYVVKSNIGEFFEYIEKPMDLEEGEVAGERGSVIDESTDEDIKDDRGYHMHDKKEFNELDTSEWVEWTKGDLVMTCHNCGNVDTVAEDIEHGIQTILPVDNHNEIRLVCSQCNSAMSLHFTRAEEGEVKEYIEASSDSEDIDDEVGGVEDKTETIGEPLKEYKDESDGVMAEANNEERVKDESKTEDN